MFRLLLLFSTIGSLASGFTHAVRAQTAVTASGFSDALVETRLADGEIIAARSRTRANVRLDHGRTRAYVSARLTQSFVDPEWPLKTAENRTDDIVKCISCNACLAATWRAAPIDCVQNPALGREKEYASAGSKQPKKVLVAGGGPGGLEAARTAALFGHNVSLYEKEPALGGQVMVAAVPESKTLLKEVKLFCLS